MLPMFLLNFLLYHAPGLQAQQEVVRGRVLDSRGDPILGCIVLMKRATDSTTMRFTTTDEDGWWKLAFTSSDIYLQFKLLGYQEQQISMSQHPPADTLIVRLRPSNFELEDVIIKAQRIAISQEGDTTIYDLDTFTTGQEKTLGDVINKLPGIEVTPDGEIQRNGERVDVLLVERKDILNNQHKLSAEGFKAEDIAGISIIENYKSEDDRLSNKGSDKVAMNIELTDEAKSRWKGNVALASGYDKKLQGDINTFNIADILSATIFVRYNNTGTALMSPTDYLSMQTSMVATLNANRDQLDNILPEHFIIPSDLSSNSDGLIAVNIHKSKNNDLSSKLSINVNQLNRASMTQFERIYRSSNEVYQGQNHTDRDATIWNSHYTDRWKLGSKTQLSLDVPMMIKDWNEGQDISGSFQNRNIQSRNTGEDRLLSLLPSLKFSHQLSEQWHYNLNLLGSLDKHNTEIDLTDVSAILATTAQHVSQSRDTRSWLGGLEGEVEYKSGIHSGGISIKSLQQGRSLSAVADADVYTFAQQTYRHPELGVEGFYRMYNQKWIVEPALSLQSHMRRLNEDRQSTATYQGDLLLKYEFSRLHFFLLRTSIGTSLPSFEQLYRVVSIQDNLNVVSSALTLDQKTTKRNLSLSYLRFTPSTGSRINMMLRYNHSTESPLLINRTEDNHILSQWKSADAIQNWSLSNTIYQPLFYRRWNIQTNLSYNWNSTRISGDDLFTTQRFNGSVAVASRYKKAPVNGSVGYTYNGIMTMQENNTNRLVRHSITTTLDVTPAKWASAKLRSSFHQNILRQQAGVSFLQLDVDIDITLSDKYTLTCRTNDLLNLNGTANVQAVYNAVYIAESSFTRFPGYILLGIQRSF